MKQGVRLLLIAAALLPLTVSCVRYGGPSNLRRDLSREAGVKLDAHFAITVTRSGVALARMFTDEEEVPLKGVRRVEVGVYEVKGLRRGVDSRQKLSMTSFPELTPVVRVHEDDEDVFVLVQEDEQQEIRQLVVVVAEDDEWVLVRVRGKLQHTVEQAMAMALDKAGDSDKYDSVLRAYHEAQAERERAAAEERADTAGPAAEVAFAGPVALEPPSD